MAHLGHDCGAARKQRGGAIEVHISMETAQPPTGLVVTVDGEPAQPFAGWLQLLTILAKALRPPPAARLTRRSETPP
jgi:hypothetical protein